MRVYFLSYRRAALKLNGIYLGLIDGFERHVEIDLNDEVFAEITPENDGQTVNFFVTREFLDSPPDFADVYFMEDDALIYIKKYEHKGAGIAVLFQARALGLLFTVFSQGDIYLSCEGARCTLNPLPSAFLNCRGEEQTIAGAPVYALRGDNFLCVVNTDGEIIFLNEAESFEFGERLKVRAGFNSCAAACADCEYAFEGGRLKLVKSETIERQTVDESVLHFAFFESVLYRGDFKKYLCADLQGQADRIKDYLGGFCGVCVPTEKFYIKHGDARAAGLVYPVEKNLFRVKYFGVELQDGKISNLLPL